MVLLLAAIAPLRTLEARFSDAMMSYLVNVGEPSKDIVIVKITEDTLAKLAYRSPIDRQLMANILTKILAADPMAIGIDLLIDQASEPEKDDQLLSILRANPQKVFVAYGGLEDGLSEAQVNYENEALEGVSKAIVVLSKDNNDGVVRHFLESRVVEENVIPTLAHAVGGTWNRNLKTGFSRIVYQPAEDGVPHEYAQYPAHAVKVLPPAWFKDKYVLIGADLPNIDVFRTPFVASQGESAGILAGVKIHAHILQQLLSNLRVSELGVAIGFIFNWLAGLVGVLVVSTRRSVWMRVVMVVTSVSVIVAFSTILFYWNLILVPAMAMCATMIISAITSSSILWQRDRQEKRFIRDAWSQYVSPAVVADLISHPDKLEQGGEQKDVSYIFSDIAGFTTMAEGMSVDQLSEVLNQYLDRISAEFFKAGATIDKFVGDAVIGFLGAPLADIDHPNKAVSLALAIDRCCREYQQLMAKEGIKFGHTRIGVHSGPAIIGNFGGSGFFDYTGLGDTVNTASRLEGANKMFSSHICVSGATAQRANAHKFRPMGRLILAGKTKPIEAFEPMDAIRTPYATIERYANAYEDLDRGNSDNLKNFQKLAKDFPEDYLVACHLGRLKNGQNSTLIDLTKGPKL